ncbi:MAG: methionine--tRNA ligase [Candidatus Nomurabacteria bacterium]|nr:methionine--tRNA ligase [Candidatus Nomurabacteria bacterium]
MEYVTYEEFNKMDIRVGTIREVEPIADTEKLLCCQVDFGEVDENGDKKLRQIISGIHLYYPDVSVLINKKVLYIINLEPRKIKGYESNGMLMAIDGMDGSPVFLVPEVDVNTGSKVR